MCGIVGYIGKRDSVPIILDALRRLEYRGYDSAGIAVIDDAGALAGSKAEGKLSRLAERLQNGEALSGVVGVGHTRWATHGRPSDANAHPHLDCRGKIAVVHNGIIENYAALRARLIELGHTFTSETDTEVLAHLIEVHYDGDLAAAVRKSLREVRGAYALGVISSDDPEHLVFARNGASPLVIGIGEGEMFVASDTPAILPYTRRKVILQEGEMAVVGRDGFRLTDYDGTPIERQPVSITWDAGSAEKSGYKHFMLKEIFEQPNVIKETLAGRIDEIGDVHLAEEIGGITPERLRTINKIAITGCGTAYHAGMVGMYLLRSLVRLPVEMELASEFRYGDPVMDPATLVIAMSQSGETADTIEAVRIAKEAGCDVLGICNVLGSHLSRMADGTLYTRGGPEIGVAATKTYVSQVTAMTLLALYLARLRGTADPSGSRDRRRHAPAAGGHRRRPQHLRRDSQGRARAAQSAERALHRPLRELSDRARRRAQAQGDLVHSRRGVRGGRDEARPDRAARFERTGRRHRHARPRAREDALEPHGVQGPRSAGRRRRQPRRRRGGARSPITSSGFRKSTRCSPRSSTSSRCNCSLTTSPTSKART